jgi:hypothetical protein
LDFLTGLEPPRYFFGGERVAQPGQLPPRRLCLSPGAHREQKAPFLSARRLPTDLGTTALEAQRTYKMVTGSIAQVAINAHIAPRFCHSMTSGA